MGNGSIRGTLPRVVPVEQKKWLPQRKVKKTLSWEGIPANYDLHARSGHGIAGFGKDKMLIFGGLIGSPHDSGRFEDPVVFDDLHKNWVAVKCSGPKPSSRASHAMCSDGGDNIFVVGGTTADGLLGDMYRLNTRKMHWTKLEFEDELSKKILCLYGQTLVKYKSMLISCGGTTGLSYTSHSFLFDLNLSKWSCVQTSGNRPSPRYQHKAFIASRNGSDSMYILGGGNYRPLEPMLDTYSLDLDSWKWNKIFCSGAVPSSRFAFDLTYDTHSNKCFIFGGLSRDLSTLNDLFSLDIYTMSWTKVKIRNSPPQRAFHTLFAHKGQVYLVGGANGQQRFKQMWRFRVREEVKSLMELSARCLMRKEQAKTKRSRYAANMNLYDSLPQELLEYMADREDTTNQKSLSVPAPLN